MNAWLPVAVTAELRSAPVKRVRVCGRSCVLTRNGTMYALHADGLKRQRFAVKERNGLVWAYFGPAPAPEVPDAGDLIPAGAIRMVGTTHVRGRCVHAANDPAPAPRTLAVDGGWTLHAFANCVPIDDEDATHWWYAAFVPPPDAHVPQRLLDAVPHFDLKRDAWELHALEAPDVPAFLQHCYPYATELLEAFAGANSVAV